MITTPVRKFHLVQIGVGVVPRLDASTEINFSPRMAIDELHGGGTVDYYRNRHAPLQFGNLKHTGRYAGCGVPCTTAYTREELDFLQQAKTDWTPFLFFVDKGECSNPPLEPYFKPVCGIYLWAMGKVTDLNSIMNAEDYLAPSVAQVTLTAAIKTPLIRATYSRWRFGYNPSIYTITGYVPPIRLDSETEKLIAEPADEWYMPCGLNPLCDDERFWPRNLYDDDPLIGSIEYDWTKWECRYTQIEAGSQSKLMMYGNTHPRTRMVARGDAELTIRNEFGTYNYRYDMPATDVIYTDSWTGVVMGRNLAGDISPVNGGIPPQLAWGDNIISSTAPLVIGGHDAWIN